MGFGTLFFGYFLLLNIAYFEFTDLIAALIMAIGLYKLSEVNSQFRYAFFSSIAFAAVGLFELAAGAYRMFFSASTVDVLFSYAGLIRCIVIATLTLFTLKGIKTVAEEVELKSLSLRAKITMPISLAIFLIYAILALPISVDDKFKVAQTYLNAFAIFSVFTIVIINLITIYRAYMKICMPEDVDNEAPDKPSRFEFINKHRAHTEKKQKEYAEYRLEKYKKKNEKKKKK